MRDNTLARAMQEARPAEKEAALMLMQRAETAEETAAVTTLLMSGRRRRQQYASDHLTDRQRRKTMPARVPIETARRYEECAKRRHMSVYAWVCHAMDQQYRRDTTTVRSSKASLRSASGGDAALRHQPRRRCATPGKRRSAALRKRTAVPGPGGAAGRRALRGTARLARRPPHPSRSPLRGISGMRGPSPPGSAKRPGGGDPALGAAAAPGLRGSPGLPCRGGSRPSQRARQPPIGRRCGGGVSAANSGKFAAATGCVVGAGAVRGLAASWGGGLAPGGSGLSPARCPNGPPQPGPLGAWRPPGAAAPRGGLAAAPPSLGG